MRIAVIGAGISGIAAAKTLMKFGHQPVLFERSAEIGGVWALAYPQVRLQNIGDHYRFTDFFRLGTRTHFIPAASAARFRMRSAGPMTRFSVAPSIRIAVS